MTFLAFASQVHANFTRMSKSELFTVNRNGVSLFDEYLKAFPVGSNPVYKTNTEHNCNTCHSFIRAIGHVVAINNGVIETVWDGVLGEPYATVAFHLANLVRTMPINGIFRTNEPSAGRMYNFDIHGTRFEHLHAAIARAHLSATPGAARGFAETTAGVFRRGLEELTMEALTTVKDLIDSRSLYRGEEHVGALDSLIKLHRDYPRTGTETAKSLFVWSRVNDQATRFKNTVIGTLVEDLSKGVDTAAAVASFEAKVAPSNYKRPTAVVTTTMVDQALATVRDLGLKSALYRRHAHIEDVSVNNVLFVDNAVRGQMRDALKDLIAPAVKPMRAPTAVDESISAAEFLSTVLPGARKVEAGIRSNHLGAFVSLTTAVDPTAKSLYKWSNPFAWTYIGNVADSIKQRVKKAGGNINAHLRVSLAWFNFDDLDIHVTLPRGTHVYFGNKEDILDVDMNAGYGTSREAVENLAWTRSKLTDGLYKVWVNQWAPREDKDVGFTVEMEHEGTTRTFQYDKRLPHMLNVPVFDFMVQAGKVVALTPHLTETPTTKTQWGVTTDTWTPVDSIMSSPNYWDDNAVGNKHLFFILKGCANPEPIRGLYNEFLRSDLDKHRKVLEVIGSRVVCEPEPRQLSGVGFSSTRPDSIMLKVDGRPFNILF